MKMPFQGDMNYVLLCFSEWPIFLYCLTKTSQTVAFTIVTINDRGWGIAWTWLVKSHKQNDRNFYLVVTAIQHQQRPNLFHFVSAAVSTFKYFFEVCVCKCLLGRSGRCRDLIDLVCVRHSIMNRICHISSIYAVQNFTYMYGWKFELHLIVNENKTYLHMVMCESKIYTRTGFVLFPRPMKEIYFHFSPF